MLNQLKILKQKDGSFEGSGGDQISYYWITAEQISDGLSFQFGTKKDYAEKIGQVVDVDILKYQDTSGAFRYKENVEN